MSDVLNHYLEHMKNYDNHTCNKQTESIENNPTNYDFNINQYILIDSLKNDFHINPNDETKINSFICQKNDFNNTFMNLLVYISNKIHEINPTIKLSLNLVQDYSEELLEISVKLEEFEDLAKVEKIDDELSEIYSFEFLDNIVLYVEF